MAYKRKDNISYKLLSCTYNSGRLQLKMKYLLQMEHRKLGIEDSTDHGVNTRPMFIKLFSYRYASCQQYHRTSIIAQLTLCVALFYSNNISYGCNFDCHVTYFPFSPQMRPEHKLSYSYHIQSNLKLYLQKNFKTLQGEICIVMIATVSVCY